jgi:predicted nucleic acid-binding protein
VDGIPELFDVRPLGRSAYQRARDILAQYIDQSFSYVDAAVFAVVDDDPTLDQILTVDGRDFSIYRFAHSVEIVVP